MTSASRRRRRLAQRLIERGQPCPSCGAEPDFLTSESGERSWFVPHDHDVCDQVSDDLKRTNTIDLGGL